MRSLALGVVVAALSGGSLAHGDGGTCRHDEFVDRILDHHIEDMRLRKAGASAGGSAEYLPVGKVPLSKIGKPLAGAPTTHAHDILSSSGKGLHMLNMYSPARDGASGPGGIRLASEVDQTSGQWRPLRLKPIFLDSLDAQSSKFLNEEVLPTVISRVGEMLSVPVRSEPLFAHRRCERFWTNQQPWRCNELEDASENTCGSTSEDATPVRLNASWFGADEYYAAPTGSATTIPAGVGLADADVGLIVTARTVSPCQASTSAAGGTRAFASFCQSDPATDRPTFGRANVCPAELPAPASGTGAQATWHQTDIDGWIKTLTHETFHVLGLSSTSYALYRDRETGNPLTPRSEDLPSRPADSQEIKYQCQGSERTFYVASTNTVNLYSERGMDCTQFSEVITEGMFNCVQRVVVEPAQESAKSFFGCESIPGIELENQDTTPCVIHPSHTESRVARTDLMNAVKREHRDVTAASLSILDSSGWYTANYSALSPMLYNRDFGFQAGCDFAVGNKCLQPGNPPTVATSTGAAGNPLTPHYCTENSGDGLFCTLDRKSIGKCFLERQFGSDLPEQYRYFTSNARLGGYIPAEADYCPIIESFTQAAQEEGGDTTTTSCTDPRNLDSLAGSENVRGMTMGAGSVCLDTSLEKDGWSGGLPLGCYEVTCTSSPVKVVISVPSTSGSGFVSAECEQEGDDVTFTGYSGGVTCPSPSEVCQEYLGVRPGPGAGTVAAVTSDVDVLYSSGTATVSVERIGGSTAISMLVRTVAADSAQAAAAGIQSTYTVGGLTSAVAVEGTDYNNATQVVTWAESESGSKEVDITLPSGGGPVAAGVDVLVLGVVLEQAPGAPEENQPEVAAGRQGTRVLLFNVLPSPSPVPVPSASPSPSSAAGGSGEDDDSGAQTGALAVGAAMACAVGAVAALMAGAQAGRD